MSVELQEMPHTVSEQVIERIADREGVDPTALVPLYEVIGPEALDSPFSPTLTSNRRPGAVKFSYCGYDVTVSFDDNEDITIELTDHFEQSNHERSYERNR